MNLGVVNAERSESRWGALEPPPDPHSLSGVCAEPYYPASKEGRKVQATLPPPGKVKVVGFFDYCFSPSSPALF